MIPRSIERKTKATFICIELLKFIFSILILFLLTIESKGQVANDSIAAQELKQDSISDTTAALVVHSEVDSSLWYQRRVSSELNFALYLVTNEQYDNAFYLLNELGSKLTGVTDMQRDSIHYLTGWLNYFSQNFSIAIDEFDKIQASSSLGKPAKFYESICYVHLKDYSNAKSILNTIPCDTGTLEHEFKAFQFASIALLERDYVRYDSIREGYTFQYFQFSSEQKAMDLYYEDLSTYKRKSPFIAGFLSALFPGLGKLYTGYRGMPLGAMYMNLPLAAVAIEIALLAGIMSPPFFVFGALFGIFYVGNIWGSAVSVYAIEKELYAEIDHNILFDMHIPLRRLFWQ